MRGGRSIKNTLTGKEILCYKGDKMRLFDGEEGGRVEGRKEI